MAIDFYKGKSSITTIHEPFLSDKNIHLDLLRLDEIHPQISGNKWFKLKYNIQAAKSANYNTLLSFGGAYSNHLHALAYAGFQTGMKTIGIVRGEEVKNPTLEDCSRWGMHIQFVTRQEYLHRNHEDFIKEYSERFPSAFVIPEGGNNEYGIKGCEEILPMLSDNDYDAVAVSIGSGATSIGLARSMKPMQTLLCFSSFRKQEEWRIEMEKCHSNYELIPVFQYGRFGQVTEELRQFKNDFYFRHSIELDYIYTAKMMMALYERLMNETNKRVLAIHTGGLQGNRGFE